MVEQLAIPFDDVHQSASPRLVATLRGSIPSGELGVVLIHEHLFNRLPPRSGLVAAAGIALTAELDRLWNLGVRTIVDVTAYVSPVSLAPAVSRHRINIICCAGYYLARTVPAKIRRYGIEELEAQLLRKICHGYGAGSFHPGIIKVASAGSCPTGFEARALAAAGRVQSRTDLPVMVHSCEGASHQLRILIENGADPERIILSHVESELRRRDAKDVWREIFDCLASGASIFVNNIGATDSPFRRRVLDLVEAIRSAGLVSQLFVGADAHWKWQAKGLRFSGTTRAQHRRDYSFTHYCILPLLRSRGFGDEEITCMLEHNPKRILGSRVDLRGSKVS